MTVQTKSLGGGSSAVAASSHAACARFRGTDPLVTGMSRRKLAKALGKADVGAGIPEARWVRAVTFERLVRNEQFASEIATTTVGNLHLDRPTEVVIANARVNVERSAKLLHDAHCRAVQAGAATLIHALAVPFAGYEHLRATDVKPDFAVVAPKITSEGSGSWLVVGDAKDYERLRSRIEDSRLLKGFLQVAIGAESYAAWSRLPAGMEVHRWGVLAVPRNAFLQPEALIEDVADHRAEVRMRIDERHAEAARATYDEKTPIGTFVAHLKATFDPGSCRTCSLFAYCRDELRHSTDPADMLVELGIPEDIRRHVIGLVDGSGNCGPAPATVIANIQATINRRGDDTGQKRIDPAGLPGTVNVVIVKSDAAALGIHGIATQRITASGRKPWKMTVFDDPRTPATRQAVMNVLGKDLADAMAEMRKENEAAPAPVHLVVPDKVTADVLVSIADNLAGLELSRLRWEHDVRSGRPALTFNGEPAAIPRKLRETDRTAVSFLLEEDRARAFKVRCPIVDARSVLARHLIAGGPAVESLRLDYLVAWADASTRVDHRVLTERIEVSEHTPGARLANGTSDQIHRALSGGRGGSHRGRPADPETYRALVEAELVYKRNILEQALDALDRVPSSKLRTAYRSIEGDAQAIWRRRLLLHASDLVRFGRTYRWWRNSQVRSIESDVRCDAQLLALTNPRAAHDLATAAGTREIAFASVVSTDPIALDIDSRRITDGSRIVLMHVDDQPCVEAASVIVETKFKASLRIDGLAIGPLSRIRRSDPPNRFRWEPAAVATVRPGDRLIVAEFAWFSVNTGNRFLKVDRPAADTNSAPTPDCEDTSYSDDPSAHRYCCRPHEVAEAEWSDELADRRSRGELNPQRWPPVRDGDAFEVVPEGAATDDATEAVVAMPDGLTMDDVD